MTAIHVDSTANDSTRREMLYAGDIFVYSPRPSTLALIQFARDLIDEAFAPYDAEVAQHQMPVEAFVEIFGPVKPRFIHHPKTKGLLRDVVTDFGCDLDEIHIDVPRLRGVTSDKYLTAGVGYAFPPHRDTWWSAPMAQLNWWLPITPLAAESTMAFHPAYWTTPVSNGSEEFNYYEYNATGRKEAAKHVTTDLRKQPGPREEMTLEPQIRIVCPIGGIILFSGAQMHSTVPNTCGRTRFSIDFRTVSLLDLREGGGAPNVDTFSQGTSLRDFRRGSDGAPMPREVVAHYDSGDKPEGGVLVFEPSIAELGRPVADIELVASEERLT